MQCTNHLKQLGLAQHNHHDIYESFTQSSRPMTLKFTFWGPNATYAYWGYIQQMLPFFEQGAIYEGVVEAIRADFMWNPWRSWETAGGRPEPYVDGQRYDTVWAREIPTLICPSTAGTGFTGTSDNGKLGRNSYHCNVGDLFCEWDSYHALRGPFGPGDRLQCSFGHITDGTSNTGMISEVEIGSAPNGTSIKGNVAVEVPYGPPLTCKAVATTSGQFDSRFDAAGKGEDYADRTVGCRWGDSRPTYTQFFMNLPPNQPNCSQNNNAEGWGLVMTASSNHTGGVNLVMCDGAVRFVSDSVDAGDQGYDPWDGVLQRGGQWGDHPGSQALLDRHGGDPDMINEAVSGPSRYGVWGALGSKAGGESRSL
jgi:hypothetical protein